MRNIKLTIEYDGTGYHGWQSQDNASTVQDTIENAIVKLTGEQCCLNGSSRTDTGVHALGQVANFFTESSIPGDKFSFALNSILPRDISIKQSEEVEMDFHARFNSKGKKYRYLIYNSRQPSALLRNRAVHVPVRLDEQKMLSAAQFLLGKHDFTSFRASGSTVKTTERTIYSVSLKRSDDLIEFEIEGDGFLYNMVRIIVGTLIQIGSGKLEVSDMPHIIEVKDRRQAGLTAPAQGLYLIEVYY